MALADSSLTFVSVSARVAFRFWEIVPIEKESADVKQTEAHARSLQTACTCARIADEYRGREIVILDLTEVTPIVDFFVIASGTSRRQMHAIAGEVNRVLKSEGHRSLGREGYDESTWILQDYGDVVLHVFTDDAREMYDLESLWADATRIDWQTGSPVVETTVADSE